MPNLRMAGIAAILGLSLSACGTPSFQEGRFDGCQSGYWAGGMPYTDYVKNDARAATDAEYASAWKEFYEHCRYDYESKRGDAPG